MKSEFEHILNYSAIDWIPYKNKRQTSGVKNYCIDGDSIWIEFKTNSIYLYNVKVTGDVVNEMIIIAPQGENLSSYINRITKERKKYVVKYILENGKWVKAT
jgi:hypothetical protein